MNTKHQVFISSTFTDLIEERRLVMETILQMDCIPAGMELFPATNDEQFQFIKNVIKDCDYYVIILGGRYGTTSSESGLGFTEMEFEYAKEIGIPILGFIHKNPMNITVGKSETDPAAVLRLSDFRRNVGNGRLVKFWETKEELASQVVFSITNAIKTIPRPGWTRGGVRSNQELLEEVDRLRNERDELSKAVSEQKARVVMAPEEIIPNLAQGDERFNLTGTFSNEISYRSQGTYRYEKKWSGTTTWNELIYYLQPQLLEWKHDARVKSQLGEIFGEKFAAVESGKMDRFQLNDDCYYTLRAHLMALGWVEVKSLNTKDGGSALFWHNTSRGNKIGISLRVQKSGV